MKTFTSSVLALFLLSFAAPSHAASKNFETTSINIGYLGQQDFGDRVAVQDLAAYIQRLQAVCSRFFAPNATPENLSIVVAIKSSGHSRVWFVSSRAPAASEKREELRSQLEAVELPKVSGGPVAFAIEARIAGGSGEDKKDAGPPPTPAEWEGVLSKLKEPLHFDRLLPLVWPD